MRSLGRWGVPCRRVGEGEGQFGVAGVVVVDEFDCRADHDVGGLDVAVQPLRGVPSAELGERSLSGRQDRVAASLVVSAGPGRRERVPEGCSGNPGDGQPQAVAGVAVPGAGV